MAELKTLHCDENHSLPRSGGLISTSLCVIVPYLRTTKATKMRFSPKDRQFTQLCQKTRTFEKSQIFRTPGQEYWTPVAQKGVKFMRY